MEVQECPEREWQHIHGAYDAWVKESARPTRNRGDKIAIGHARPKLTFRIHILGLDLVETLAELEAGGTE